MSESTSEIRGAINTAWHETRTANSEAAFVLPHLTPGSSLLDCGCGPGTITIDLAQHLAPGSVVGIDLDPGRVERAKRLAEDRGVTNVRFDVGSALELPYEDGTFDAVFCNMVLMHLPDAERGLSEMLRVLRPGGLCAASESDHDGQFSGMPDPDYDEFQKFYEEYQASRGTDYYIGKRLKGMLYRAGCLDLEVDATTRLHSTPAEIAQWAALGAQLLDNPQAQAAAAQRYPGSDSRFKAWRTAINRWSERPHSLVVQVRIQVTGVKPT